MSFGACMSVLIAMISAPLPGAEHAAAPRAAVVAAMQRQRESSRFPEVFADKDVVSPQKRTGALV